MACIFCGRAGPMSKEHLWPAWAQRTFEADERAKVIPHSIEGHDLETRAWQAPVFSATLKRVCIACNNGWMADIEAIAKDLCGPMVSGEPRFLRRDEQMLISAWAYLKVALAEQVDRRQRLIPASRYRRIYAAAQHGGMTVPISASVFIAAHEGELDGQYQHRLLGQRGAEADLFIATFTLRHLVLQVVENLAGEFPVLDLEREPVIARRVGRIWLPSRPSLRPWPPARGLHWPPGSPLDDVLLTIFTGPLPRQDLCD